MSSDTLRKVRGSAKPQKLTNDRITVESLKFYIPLFHMGDQATERLLDEGLSSAERNSLETRARLKELSVEKIAALSGPLITRELNKMISNSHLGGKEDLFDILYYAGINGLIKGLRHFEVEKMNKSSTNYIFQWITTYAKKELTAIEAPFGIAPSRFQKYKKISAVRKKLSEELGRYAENNEVLDYFKSGKADMRSMNGRVSNAGKPSLANLNMTIDSIEEQEHFEKNLSYTTLIDPHEDHSFEARLSEIDKTPLFETTFGSFLDSYNFTLSARAVLLSDLKSSGMTNLESNEAINMDKTEYKSLSNRWRDLMRDINGPFYKFLKTVEKDSFSQFDVIGTIQSIEAYNKPVNEERYLLLFEDKEIREL
jgi:DNA-directed RNA polymerase specialized sigma subunit